MIKHLANFIDIDKRYDEMVEEIQVQGFVKQPRYCTLCNNKELRNDKDLEAHLSTTAHKRSLKNAIKLECIRCKSIAKYLKKRRIISKTRTKINQYRRIYYTKVIKRILSE